MTSENKSDPQDAGLFVLVSLLRIQGIGADPEQIRHSLGSVPIGISEMLRCAKNFGLKARNRVVDWDGLSSTPMPAIAARRDGGFMLLGKAGDDKILVQTAFAPRPELMTREQFEAVCDGHVVLMTRRVGLVDLSRRFDITWFLGAIHKYRHQLGEVFVASFFLQLFALISPLFFQVVIDKVLVHRSTEHARCAGDRARHDLGVRDDSRHPAHLSVCAYDEPHRRRARRSAVSSSPGAADRLFPGAPRRRFRWRACASWKISAIFSRAPH